MSLGWLSPVPGPHAAGLSSWLLGCQEHDGGESVTSLVHLQHMLFLMCFSEWFYCPEKNKGHDVQFQFNETHKALSQYAQYLFQMKANYRKPWCYLCVYTVRVFIRFNIVCSLSVIGSCNDMSSGRRLTVIAIKTKKRILQLKTSTEIRWRCEHMSRDVLEILTRARTHTDADADECTQIRSCINSWIMSH